jgi:hypothetical protein
MASAALLAGCRQSADENEAVAAPRVSLVAGSNQCDTADTPFCDSTVALPADWTGNVFKLAQDYPATAGQDAQPWLAFDPVTQPQQYIQAVLDYFYEGNIRDSVEASFDPALNTARQWYNAPWQDYGPNGREPAHGLTRERVNQPGELDPKQTSLWNNYAVGFYNAAAAGAIGQMWANHGAPDPSKAMMAEGAVGAKLLFTTATVEEVPYLQGSPEWLVYIASDVNSPNPDPSKRAAIKVRLLQIDIAVKDKRSPVGWVFGTFVYGGGPAPHSTSGSGWRNVSAVGLMWGNDPGFDPAKGKLQQSWINPAVSMPHLGYQGRLNGPVDNPQSSCLSCHSTAQTPINPPGMFPPSKRGQPPAPDCLAFWFRNVPTGTPFLTSPSALPASCSTGTGPAAPAGRPAPAATSLDYSLQVAYGLANFKKAHAPPTESSAVDEDTTPPRDGGDSH